MVSRTSFSTGFRLKNGLKAALVAAGLCLATMAVSTATMAQAGGTPWGWGDNVEGQVGDGTSVQIRSTPVQVLNLIGTTMMAGGHQHSVALKNDGTVWAWGYNYYGELGNGNWTDSIVPVPVLGLAGMTAVAAGFNHCLALASDGTVWGWGVNGEGELGIGTYDFRSNVPVQTSFPVGTVITGIAGGGQHSLALKNDGTVWAWGYNVYGALGDGTTVQFRNIPVQVLNLTGAIAIAGGDYHSLALKGDGTVWAWGYNGYGQLGNGTNTNSNVPVRVSNLTGVTAITSGWFHSLALKSDGTVWAWGQNWYGQLGPGVSGDSNIPVLVPGLTGMTAIAAGFGHTVALKNDGTVWAWGYNGEGELGNGTSGTGTSSSIPVRVLSPNGAITIASGAMHGLATVSPLPPEAAGGDVLATAQLWSDKNTQTWPAVAGADSYKMYRGTKADLPNLLTSGTDSCTRYEGAATSAATADDPATLGAGDFYWYIVVAVNAYGEGSAGHALAGGLMTTRIVNSSGACP